MVVFEFEVATVNDCHFILEHCNIGEGKVDQPWTEQSTLVWQSKDFIGIHHTDNDRLELYGTKNTNSVKYYTKNFPNLEYDNVSVIKTKRW